MIIKKEYSFQYKKSLLSIGLPIYDYFFPDELPPNFGVVYHLIDIVK